MVFLTITTTIQPIFLKHFTILFTFCSLNLVCLSCWQQTHTVLSQLIHCHSALKKRRKTQRKIKKKNTTKKFRTHHTPTQEYVVPKSIPIAGPSDLDMFVCVVVVCVLSNFLWVPTLRRSVFLFREKFCAETLNCMQRELFLRRTVFVLHFCCAN